MSFSIIIPSKNASNLVPCVRAIREAGETARIIVVDDFEECLSIDICEDAGLDLRTDLVQTGADPFIFARNINIGIKAAGGDDVILLNDDALLKEQQGFTAMETTMSIMATPSGYGLLASSCDTVGNPNQHRRPLPGACQTFRPEPRMVCFVCVYIPRSTINRVGLLDERFVNYGMEDDDYCLRVRNAGLKLGVFDGCFVDHGSLQSSFRGGPQSGGDFTANMRRFIEKWGVDNWNRPRETSEFRHLFSVEVAK